MKNIAIKSIRLYQGLAFLLRPFLFVYTPCRHYPTCSDYGIQTIREEGVLKGIFKAMQRIFNCNPWTTVNI